MATNAPLTDFPHLARLVGLSAAELTKELDAFTAIARSRGAKVQRAVAEAAALVRDTAQETQRAQPAR